MCRSCWLLQRVAFTVRFECWIFKYNVRCTHHSMPHCSLLLPIYSHFYNDEKTFEAHTRIWYEKFLWSKKALQVVSGSQIVCDPMFRECSRNFFISSSVFDMACILSRTHTNDHFVSINFSFIDFEFAPISAADWWYQSMQLFYG